MSANPPSAESLVLAAVKQELTTLKPYFEILRRQLDSCVKDSDAGVQAVVEQIGTVHGLSSAQVARLERSMDQCLVLMDVTRQQTTQNQQVVGLVRTEIEAHQAELDRSIERNQHLAREVNDLRKIVGLITEISSQTHLLAINATLQATHAGVTGRGFAVVAAEVKTLALRTAVAAKEIAGKIGSISARMTHELATTESDAVAVRASADHLAQLIQTIDGIGRKYGSAGADLQTINTSIQASNDGLIAQLSEALGHLQFQDVLRQRLNQVNGALVELTAHTQGLLGNLGQPGWSGMMTPTLEERMDRQRFDYVMESQRASHDRVRGGGGGESNADSGPGLAIELF